MHVGTIIGCSLSKQQDEHGAVMKDEKDYYGISRIDDELQRAHSWRVSLRRNGRSHVKNFPDKRCGGREYALCAARQYRDHILSSYPPVTRKEVCAILRSNNTSGISGVCTYTKSYKRRDGSMKENWYWEASWPDAQGQSVKSVFSVNTYGEKIARQMAIRARTKAVADLEGYFWPSERGAVNLQSEDGLARQENFLAVGGN